MANGFDLAGLADKVQAANRNVPFGNSAFQTRAFTGGEHGPARRVRSLLLNINDKIRACREEYFRRRRTDIDVREIKEKLQTAIGFDRERLLLDLEEKESCIADMDKLLEDASVEIHVMLDELQSLPSVNSRDEFEAAEPAYWVARLWADAQREITSNGAPAIGTVAALNQMGCDVSRDIGAWRLSGPTALIETLPGGIEPMRLTHG